MTSPVTSPNPSFEPESFGKYYLIDKVAVGGMAEVFRAKSFSEGGFEKLLVIKRILGHLSDNRDFVDMFIDEAKISVLLQQPNIVQVYDFGQLRENYFIAMEFVDGKDVKGILRKLAARRKLMPVEFAVYIAHETCKGLDYAHKKTNLKGEPLGIIHRDMSPSNILVSYTGEVKIADFGIAKAQISAYNTKDGVLKGKFEYMSPEQASGADIDHRSDLFSLGIILHEMLTGRRLFKTDSEIKTLEKIKAVDIKEPSAINPNVPARLDEITMRALSRDPAVRYADAKEMQTALLDFIYPSTPDLTRESFSHFMGSLFAEEISEERDRMEEGTKVAVALWQEEPELLEPDEDWREGAASTGTMTTPPSRIPVIVAALALLFAAGLAAFIYTRPPPEVIEKVVEVQAPKPTHGALHLRVSPEDVAATATLGGAPIGTGAEIIYEDVPPGEELELRVEAEGYEPFVDTVRLDAGERLRLPVRLRKESRPVEVSAPSAETSTAAVAAQVVFSSKPSGASVYADGKLLGKTPLTWTTGEIGHNYPIVVKLDGYDDASGSITFPSTGRQTFGRNLSAKEADAPGKVSVNVSQGWAEVWIDGQKIETTPLFNHELSAGNHSIRVYNPSTGLDETRSVRVQSGKSERVSFQVD